MSDSLKRDLIAGTSRRHSFYCEALERDVTIRPLTDAELAEADAAAVRGQTYKGRVGEKRPSEAEIDVVASQQGQTEARWIRVAYGLSVDGGDKWTPREVAKYIPPKAIREIVAEVDALSGGDELEREARRQAARHFRGDSGGSDGGAAASDGDATGGDST